MGHHIDADGRFQSDKHPELPPDKIVVSFTDGQAHAALATLADSYASTDPGLAEDIKQRLATLTSSCMACPAEVRGLYDTATALLALRGDPDRWDRKIVDRLDDLQRAANALTPLVERHVQEQHGPRHV